MVGDKYFGAFGSEFKGYGCADAAGGTGHYGDFSGEGELSHGGCIEVESVPRVFSLYEIQLGDVTASFPLKISMDVGSRPPEYFTQPRVFGWSWVFIADELHSLCDIQIHMNADILCRLNRIGTTLERLID